MNTKCKIHPDYQAKRKPTSKKEGCTCQDIWNTKEEAERLITDQQLMELGYGVSMSSKNYSRWSNKKCTIILVKDNGVIIELGIVTGRDESLNMPIVRFIPVKIDSINDLVFLLGNLKS